PCARPTARARRARSPPGRPAAWHGPRGAASCPGWGRGRRRRGGRRSPARCPPPRRRSRPGAAARRPGFAPASAPPPTVADDRVERHDDPALRGVARVDLERGLDLSGLQAVAEPYLEAVLLPLLDRGQLVRHDVARDVDARHREGAPGAI